MIYAIIQALMSAVNMGSLNAVLNANGILNSFLGSGQVILLALASIVFSIAIAFIPFIASRIVRGEVGSTMLVAVGTVVTAARLAARSYAGSAGGGGGGGGGGSSSSGGA